jgi:hypothetical protein
MVLRSQTVIEAAAETVWDRLEAIREWKASVVSLERVAGAPGEVGEVLRVGQRPVDQTVYVIQRTLAVQKPSWKLRTLSTEDGRSVDGYVSYSLAQHESRTSLTFELMARVSMPRDSLQGRTIEELAQTVTEATRTKLDKDHQVLKSLIEANPT